jgi:hypothetical protein
VTALRSMQMTASQPARRPPLALIPADNYCRAPRGLKSASSGTAGTRMAAVDPSPSAPALSIANVAGSGPQIRRSTRMPRRNLQRHATGRGRGYVPGRDQHTGQGETARPGYRARDADRDLPRLPGQRDRLVVVAGLEGAGPSRSRALPRTPALPQRWPPSRRHLPGQAAQPAPEPPGPQGLAPLGPAGRPLRPRRTRGGPQGCPTEKMLRAAIGGPIPLANPPLP